MIDERELIEGLITGRLDCYVNSSQAFNPYHPGDFMIGTMNAI